MITREPNTLPEAMEALEAVVDLERWEDIEVFYAEEGLKLPWLQEQGPSHALAMVRKIFRIVLNHLHYLDRKAVDEEERIRLFKGMKGMMATVGEAAHRLDRLAALMYGLPAQVVTDLREFHELERFYKSKLMKGPEESETMPTELATLEQLKRDEDYELFYIKHEDGHPFVSDQLDQNVKLAADFGVLKMDYVADDPLIGVREWHDKRQQETAKQMVRMTRGLRTHFYHQMGEDSERPVVQALHKALMALVLAADPHNLLVHGPFKPCFEYFDDCIAYIGEAAASGEAEGLYAELLEKLCFGLYAHVAADQEMITVIEKVLRREGRPGGAGSFAKHIRNDYETLVRALGRHPNGPLFKDLDLLIEGEFPSWDPLRLENLPAKLFDLQTDSGPVEVLRLPSPTPQTHIDHADLSPEYLNFLRASNGKHLLINLQERNSWKEGARATALEQLQKRPEFVGKVSVATLAVHGDFYLQKGPYRMMNNAEQFITHLLEQLESPHLGYFFPPALRGKLFPNGMHELVETVHTALFEHKGQLSRKERCHFIDLTHLLLILKMVEETHPRYLAMVDKDGIDSSMALTALLDAGLKVLHEQPYSKIDERHLWQILFIPALLNRERPLMTSYMRRLVDTLEFLETRVQERLSAGERHLLHEQLAHAIGIKR
jgi:hypothetical protein